MRRPAGIRRKLWVVFVMQLAAISFATVLSVYGAATILEDVLIKQALKEEAAHFWAFRAADPSAQLPNTANMRGYLLAPGGTRSALPAALRALAPGYHRLGGSGHEDLVYVTDAAPGQLYLVFKQEQVDRLAFLFGFVPLSVVLLIIYITHYLTYRASRRALSPVIGLASVVRRWDPKHPDLAALEPANLPPNSDGDVEVLARALHGFASRIESFIERERNFTRDASHELRTPLTVVKVAAGVLEEEPALSPFGQRSVHRIRRAAREMEALIESFLILAREDNTGLPEEDFIANEVVRDELERAQDLVIGKPVQLLLEQPQRFALHASPRVFAVLIGNLIRNACLYTERGSVTATVGEGTVRIADTGIGMSAEELARVTQPFFRAGRSRSDGHGVGLTIVRRLADRFGWQVEFESELNAGTAVTVRFPHPQPAEG